MYFKVMVARVPICIFVAKLCLLRCWGSLQCMNKKKGEDGEGGAFWDLNPGAVACHLRIWKVKYFSFSCLHLESPLKGSSSLWPFTKKFHERAKWMASGGNSGEEAAGVPVPSLLITVVLCG